MDKALENKLHGMLPCEMAREMMKDPAAFYLKTYDN